MRRTDMTPTSATSDGGVLPPTAATRSRMMKQRQRDTKPEIALRSAMHARGWRYRVDFAPLPAQRRRADMVFTRERVAVFVDGCFWHRCPDHGTIPQNNRDWWITKLEGNVSRDLDTDARLVTAGWGVMRFWEHEGTSDAVSKLEAVLRERGTF